MTPFVRPDRCCPKCQHKGYLFRSRRTVEEAEGKLVETKYRCRACSHDWKERVPASPESPKADASGAA